MDHVVLSLSLMAALTSINGDEEPRGSVGFGDRADDHDWYPPEYTSGWFNRFWKLWVILPHRHPYVDPQPTLFL